MKKKLIILAGIVALGTFLRFYKLDELMGFIGDQGWFYLSARDILIDGKIPLVGVTASFTWLSQGALWTYMLAPALLLFNFNPLGGAYLSAFLGVLAIIMIYILGKELFSEKVGIIAAFLIATSPLAINDSRFPYHTSPLALFTLIFFYFLYKYSTSNKNYLIVASFVLGILYNLELSTMVFWVIMVVIILLVRKIDIKLIILSFMAFIVPMIPMILYDVIANNGYFQITAFLRFIKLSFEGSGGNFPLEYIVEQLNIYNKFLIFVESGFIAFLFSTMSIILLVKINLDNIKSKKINYAVLILSLWVILSILGVFAKKDISGAYIPMFYPGIIISISFLIYFLINKFAKFNLFIYLFIGYIGFINVMVVLSRDYNISGDKDVITYKETLEASREIVDRAEKNKYNLIVIGAGDKFEAYDDHFVYLTWWLGNEPVEDNIELEFTIEQKDGRIYFLNEEKDKLK